MKGMHRVVIAVVVTLAIGLVGCERAAASEVTIWLTHTDGSRESVELDRSTSRLSYSGGTLVSIEGLSALPELKELIFTRTAFVDPTFEFVADTQRLEVIVMRGVQIAEFGFLAETTYLRALVVQGSAIAPDLTIDIQSESIEYVELTNSGLTEVPRLIGRDLSDAVLNLSYNGLDGGSIAANKSLLRQFDSVLLVGNELSDEARFETISGNEFELSGNPFTMIPEEYRQYSM